MHVGIVMGSDSDLPVMKKAAEVLSGFGVTYDMAIASAHRTPKKLEEFILAQEEKGGSLLYCRRGYGGSASRRSGFYDTSSCYRCTVVRSQAGRHGCFIFHCPDAVGDSCGDSGD